MKGIFSSLILMLIISCNQRGPENVVNKSSSPTVGTSKGTISRIDLLSAEEPSFLDKLLKENESLIISNQVERFYAATDSIPILNKLVFSKDTLIDKGYVYLELEFYGSISDVNISYRYSRGTADTGYGNVTGNNTNDYLHT